MKILLKDNGQSLYIKKDINHFMVRVIHTNKDKTFWNTLFKVDKPLKNYQLRFKYHGQKEYFNMDNLLEIHFLDEGILFYSDLYDKEFFFYDGIDFIQFFYIEPK